jgi:hypothetical protein
LPFRVIARCGAEPFEPRKGSSRRRRRRHGKTVSLRNLRRLRGYSSVQPPATNARGALYRDLPVTQARGRSRRLAPQRRIDQRQGPDSPLARRRQAFNPAFATTVWPALAMARRCLKTRGWRQAKGFAGSQTARYCNVSGSTMNKVPTRSGRSRALIPRSRFHEHS